jgi:hypothetical protein
VTAKRQPHTNKSHLDVHSVSRANYQIKIYLRLLKMSKPKAKKAPPYLYEGPPPSKADREEETDDLYDTGQREAMLDNDEVTAAEAGFMMGREQEPPSKKQTRKNAISHTDEVAVELAKEDAEDD